MSGEPLIKMDEITKVFVTEEVETHALSEVTFDIAPGEFVSIAGPSRLWQDDAAFQSSGCSDTPTGGNYLLNANDASNLTASERARVRNREIGFIFQSFNLIGDLNVYENVELPLTYRGMASSERRERTNASLDRGRHDASCQAHAQPAFRWSTAARRRGSRRRW